MRAVEVVHEEDEAEDHQDDILEEGLKNHTQEDEEMDLGILEEVQTHVQQELEEVHEEAENLQEEKAMDGRSKNLANQ